MSGMNIGKAAERSGCTVVAIRHYEDEGLLSDIGRAPNGRRVYGWPDVHRLRFIRRYRDLGFKIDDLRTLMRATDMPSPDCLAVRDLAVAHIDRLRTMREEIDALERSLSSLAASCNQACAAGRSPDCKIVEGLSAASA